MTSAAGPSPAGPSPGGDRPEVPYGEWPSPISAELVTASAASLGAVAVGDGSLWWDELRPEEGGRVVVVRSSAGGAGVDVLPEGFSARTRVHEYGGGAWWLHDDEVFFANWTDQRLYRLQPGRAPWPITPEPAAPAALRYADGRVTADGRWVICVRERHPVPGGGAGDRGGDGDGESGGAGGRLEAVNEVVAVDAHGATPPVFTTPLPGTPGAGRDPDPDGGEASSGSGTTSSPAEPVVLVTGPDFVAAPRPSPDGRQLAWIQWNHPDMPWDSTELWVADLADDPAGITLTGARRVAGGADEAVVQPAWAPDGALWFASDADGWWNLRRVAGERLASGAADPPSEAVTSIEGEVGAPAWVFGISRYCFLREGGALLAYQSAGVDHLAHLSAGGAVTDLPAPYTALSSLVTFGDGAAMVAASPTTEPAVVAFDLGRPPDAADPSVDDGSTATPVAAAADPGDSPDARTGRFVVVRPPRRLDLDPALFSVPRAVTFGRDGEVAHGLHYPPTNPSVRGPAGSRPPLVVFIHGGPTSAARPQLNLALQFWTSRGFAVVDVNYRGSTGYGRAFRHALDGQWGVADVEDCVAAARHLADAGAADPDRLIIRGGSAGGFTTLCALIFHDAFAAGATLYGVADLEALARDTHKFESRYLDRLVGPYPQARQVYVDRSPIHHAERLRSPLIVFQGLEDEIVPPAQSEVMVEALAARGVPHAYVAFEGEQHGFRRAATIRRVLEAELSFYGQVLGFTPAGEIPAIEVVE